MENYELLAQYYDHFMEHVAYDVWADFVFDVVASQSLRTDVVLEVGAGTCRLAASLRDLPCKHYICTDLSPAMLRQGKNDLPKIGADITQLPFNDQSVNLVIMTYDAFNYLQPEQVGLALNEVWRVLQPGGAFIFDVTTEYNSLKWFDDYCDVMEIEGSTIVRQSWYEHNLALQHNEFSFFSPTDTPGLYSKQTEHHIQQIYPTEVLEDWLSQSGFKLVGAYGDCNFKPVKPTTERVHFVAVKP